jgi:hypothetical protein
MEDADARRELTESADPYPPAEPSPTPGGGPPPHLATPHPQANDPRFDKYRGRKRRRRPKSAPPPA